MLRLVLQHVKEGMITSRNIYSANGSLLLAKNVVLDRKLIRRLSNMGIDAIYIKNSLCDIEVEDQVLQEKTRVEAVRITLNTFEELRVKKILNVDALQDVIKKMVEDIVNNPTMLIHLTDIRTHDEYTFGHSINVCLIATMIGIKLGFPEREIKELALGALLHDVGKMLIPTELLCKSGKLTDDEWEVIQTHSEQGFEILRKNLYIPLVSAHVAYQHHENFDGLGYPRGIFGDKVHRYAKITAIADIYDALTSERPYRAAMLPHEANEILLGLRGKKLDPEYLDVFLEYAALYPVGTMVLLDNGEIGAVVKVYPKLQSRPVIKIFIDAQGNRILADNKLVDLTQELTTFIVKVYLPEEVANLSHLVKN
ncbi:MAG: hypothetical protein H6Q74_564 [Firmicutes bacterium]|nr:hypothetical protein [Bacillota bacterium]